MPTYDEISNLSDEDQEQFHRYVQKSLMRQWARAKEQIEKEIDNEQRRNRTGISTSQGC